MNFTAKNLSQNHSRLNVLNIGIVLLFMLVSTSVFSQGINIDTLIRKPGVYTLTNLHPDENRSKLYATNYQQHGLIPLCTEVELLERGRKRLVFRIKSSGREYYYDNHRNAREDFRINLAKYFGTDCKKNQIAKLGKTDQSGIKQGRALVGMTKQGVIYAIGYPPLSHTPTLEATTWKYWTNRFNTIDVVFSSDGVVTRVVE